MANTTTWGTGTTTYWPSSSGATWTPPKQGSYDDKTYLDVDKTMLKFKLRDGTEKELPLRQYLAFLAYYRMDPCDCKDEKEFQMKVMVLTI